MKTNFARVAVAVVAAGSAILMSGCAAEPSAAVRGAGLAPTAGRTIIADGSRTLPVINSKTLMQAVSNLTDGVYEGRVAGIDSYVNSDDEIYSSVQLVQRDGTTVTYAMFGGTVAGRDLKAVAEPPIGTATTESLNAPVTLLTADGPMVPRVGDELVVFFTRISGQKVPRGGLAILVTRNADGATYSFPGRPQGFLVTDRWAAPASEAELKALVAAAGKTRIRVG